MRSWDWRTFSYENTPSVVGRRIDQFGREKGLEDVAPDFGATAHVGGFLNLDDEVGDGFHSIMRPDRSRNHRLHHFLAVDRIHFAVHLVPSVSRAFPCASIAPAFGGQ